MALFVCSGNEGKLREYYAFLSEAKLAQEVVGVPFLQQLSQEKYTEPEEDFDWFLANGVLKLLSACQFAAKALRANAARNASCSIESVLVDDSGLCVPKLNFLPGVHSAYFGGQPRSAERNREVLRERIATCEAATVYHGSQGALVDGSGVERRLSGFFVCFLLDITLTPSLCNYFAGANFNPRAFQVDGLATLEQEIFGQVAQEIERDNSAGGARNVLIKLPALLGDAPAEAAIGVHFGYCAGEVSTVEQNLIPDAGHGYDSMFYSSLHPTLSFASISLAQKNGESHRAFALQAFADSKLV